MQEVSKEKFYSLIGPRDICVTSRGYDHSRYETRARQEVGRVYCVTDSSGNQEYNQNLQPVKKYFLTDWFLNAVEEA